MTKEIICFSANRRSHHDDYFLLINKIRQARNVTTNKTKLLALLSTNPIIYFDIDSKDLIYTPLIILRSLWGGKGVGLSVRTEYLIDNTETWYKLQLKRLIYFLIKYLSKTAIYSIHKGTEREKLLSKYVGGFIYDPQIWDLKILREKSQLPPELERYQVADLQDHVLLAGAVDERRCREEFLVYIQKHSESKFIVAGVMTIEDEKLLKSLPNVITISRFVSNAELFYLMENIPVIYCYYSNDRPSGFFGRSLQLHKHIIVRRNSFLHLNYINYKKLVVIDKLDDLELPINYSNFANIEVNPYDDSTLFQNIINDL